MQKKRWIAVITVAAVVLAVLVVYLAFFYGINVLLAPELNFVDLEVSFNKNLSLVQGQSSDIDILVKNYGDIKAENATLKVYYLLDDVIFREGIESEYNCPQDCAVPLTCTDSDGGKDYYVKGTATGYENGQIVTSIDGCGYDNKTLAEVYCDESNLLVEQYVCPNGCYDGACIQTGAPVTGSVIAEGTCTDSDGGKRYYTKGTISGYDQVNNSILSKDYCVDPITNSETFASEKLLEYYCNGIYVNGVPFICPNGCQNGACRYPGFIMETDKSAYTQGEIITLHVNSADGSNASVDLYVQPDGQEKIFISRVYVSGIIEINISTLQQEIFRESRNYLLLLCDAGAECMGGENTNSINVYVSVTMKECTENIIVMDETLEIGPLMNNFYNISISYMDSSSVIFQVSSQTGINQTNQLSVGDVFKLGEGAYLGVKDISYKSFAEGVSKVLFVVASSPTASCLMGGDVLIEQDIPPLKFIEKRVFDGCDLVNKGSCEGYTAIYDPYTLPGISPTIPMMDVVAGVETHTEAFTNEEFIEGVEAELAGSGLLLSDIISYEGKGYIAVFEKLKINGLKDILTAWYSGTNVVSIWVEDWNQALFDDDFIENLVDSYLAKYPSELQPEIPPCIGEGGSVPVAYAPGCCAGLALIPPKELQITDFAGYCTARCGDGFCDSTTSPYVLIKEVNIGDIEAGGEFRVSVPFTPANKGYLPIYAEVVSSSSDDNMESNNMQKSYYFVVNNGLDGKISSLWGVFALGREGIIRVDIENDGNQDIVDGNLSVFVNDELIGSQLVNLEAKPSDSYDYTPYLIVEFPFTPSAAGKVEARAVLSIEGDVEPSDNLIFDSINVYGLIETNILISDSEGNSVTRIIYDEKTGVFALNSERTYRTEFFDRENNRFSFGKVDMRGELPQNISEENIRDMNAIAIAEFKDINEISESESIISEDYNSIMQGGNTYYYVFANRLSFRYNHVNEVILINRSYATEIGMDGEHLEDYAMFICREFDFEANNCKSGWAEPMKGEFGDESGMAYFRGYGDFTYAEENMSMIEAFALGELKYFSRETTDLSAISGESAVNPAFERRAYGKIQFNGEINISRIKYDPALLESAITITHGKISINTTLLPEFRDIPATLEFRNINLRNPRILYDSSLCPTNKCSSVSYDRTQKVLTVNVTGFSSFEISEGIYCGDGSCQSSSGESCSNCVADCGQCPSATTIYYPTGGGSCTPIWNCTWGACVDKQQTYICTKTNIRCRLNTGKPSEAGQTRACLIEQECIDNDGDGYGKGKDCFGEDVNDNDPAITSTLPPAPSAGVSSLTIVIIGLLAVAIAVVAIFIVVKMRGRRKGVDEELLARGKSLAADFRARGYSDDEIRNSFRGKGWSEEEIDSVLRR